MSSAGRPTRRTLATATAEGLSLDGDGRLLDVGCGPGTVALLLAAHYAEVVGLDPDEDMLSEAERIAMERGVTNSRWVHLRAEALPADLGQFRTVTFAASFHWMDRLAVARAVRDMLEPGGAVVHVDNRYQDGTEPTGEAPHPAVPVARIAELRRAYLGPDNRAGQSVRNVFPDREDLVFREAGFDGPEVVEVPGWGLVERTVEQVAANIFSNSSTAPHLFGDRLPAFEADLRALLDEVSPSGCFSLSLPDNRLLIWRPRQP